MVPGPSTELVGGIVAFNEERSLREAVESLLSQKLPPGVRWRTIWIVASGCTDRTEAVAQSLAQRHPEVRLVVEPDRRGKASALGQIFRVATGDFLVLLNADARAQPGAVAALLRPVDVGGIRFAVMGRPVPEELPPGPLGRMLCLLWQLHHRLHLELMRTGEGTHLSDELMLLPIAGLPPLPADVVNDGAYIGAWLAAHGGRLRYAPVARVTVEVPWTVADHFRQRRRILAGHAQVRTLVGVPPTTLGRYLTQHPGRAVRLLRQAVADVPRGLEGLVCLLLAETAATLAAGWDRLPPRRSHLLWETISDSERLASTVLTGVRTPSSPGPSERAG